jgi:hypothetical protein
VFVLPGEMETTFQMSFPVPLKEPRNDARIWDSLAGTK